MLGLVLAVQHCVLPLCAHELVEILDQRYRSYFHIKGSGRICRKDPRLELACLESFGRVAYRANAQSLTVLILARLVDFPYAALGKEAVVLDWPFLAGSRGVATLVKYGSLDALADVVALPPVQ